MVRGVWGRNRERDRECAGIDVGVGGWKVVGGREVVREEGERELWCVAEEVLEVVRVRVLFVRVAVVYVVEMEGVIVMLELREGPEVILRMAEAWVVTFSAPEEPSRRSWTKYGPHLFESTCEFAGILSPVMEMISMSESSLSPSAIVPSSSAAFECGRPPPLQVEDLNRKDGGRFGTEKDWYDDIGVACLGFSYSPNASSSTKQIFEKLIRR
jgi:hypothetical protein